MTDQRFDRTVKQLVSIYDWFHSESAPTCVTRDLEALRFKSDILEVHQLIKRVAGMRWEEVPDSVLDCSHPSPFLMGQTALAYYFPAFVSIILRDALGLQLRGKSSMKTDVADSLFALVLPPGVDESHAFWKALEEPGRLAVKRTLKELGFLGFLSEKEIARSKTL